MRGHLMKETFVLQDLHKVEIGDILKKTIKDVKGKAFTK